MYVHASTRKRIEKRLADGHDVAVIALDEGLNEEVVRRLAESMPSTALGRGKPARPKPAPPPRRRASPSKLVDEAVAALVAQLAVESSPSGPTTPAPAAPASPGRGESPEVETVDVLASPAPVPAPEPQPDPEPAPEPVPDETPTGDHAPPADEGPVDDELVLDDVPVDASTAEAGVPDTVEEAVRQWPVLADVVALIRRAWHLEQDEPRQAIVQLLAAARALQAAVVAGEAHAIQEQARLERIAELERQRDKLRAQLAEIEEGLATLTTDNAPEPAALATPTGGERPATDAATTADAPVPAHEDAGAGATAEEDPGTEPSTQSAPASRPRRSLRVPDGVLVIPPARKGGQFGCGWPGCTRRFPTQQGVVVHHHRTHRHQMQEAS